MIETPSEAPKNFILKKNKNSNWPPEMIEFEVTQNSRITCVDAILYGEVSFRLDLPPGLAEKEIRICLDLYFKGVRVGEELGRKRIQTDLAKLLGLAPEDHEHSRD